MVSYGDTRGRILASALQLFGERGFDGTTVTAIEAASGLAAGSGSFYRHFKSKEEVFEAVIAHEVARWVSTSQAKPAGADVSDRLSGLAAWSHGAMDVMLQLQPLIAVLAREHGRFPEQFAQVRTQALDTGLRQLAEQLAPGGNPDDPTIRTHAMVCMSAIVGFHLIRAFLGADPVGIGREAFVGALCDCAGKS